MVLTDRGERVGPGVLSPVWEFVLWTGIKAGPYVIGKVNLQEQKREEKGVRRAGNL